MGIGLRSSLSVSGAYVRTSSSRTCLADMSLAVAAHAAVETDARASTSTQSFWRRPSFIMLCQLTIIPLLRVGEINASPDTEVLMFVLRRKDATPHMSRACMPALRHV